MDSFFTKPARVQGTEKVRPVREKSFKLPEDVSGEYKEYVAGLKFDAPFEYYHLGGINFEKSVYPSDYSLIQNQGKIFRPRFLVFALTKLQAEAVLTEAGNREVVIPATRNPKYNEKTSDAELEYLPACSVLLSDWIILEPKETFNAIKYETSNNNKGQDQKTFSTPSEIKAELLEQQKQNSKKAK